MPKKRTGGGTFDPNEEPVYFLATGFAPQHIIGSESHKHILIATNDIETPAIEEKVQRYLDAGNLVLLDSGIFNLTNEHVRAHPGMSMDDALALAPEEIDGFEQLFERYVRIATTYGERLWGYIELDQGGAENKRRTRARLEALGLAPIPVYHPFNDGADYFDELASQYDRMCFGNVVQASITERKRLVATAYERKRSYEPLWIHVLGLTPNEWLMGMPINSADSSSWLAGVRWARAKEYAGTRPLSELPIDFYSAPGADGESETGNLRVARIGGFTASMMQRNWRNHLRAVEAL